jgi:hypothetical protein
MSCASPTTTEDAGGDGVRVDAPDEEKRDSKVIGCGLEQLRMKHDRTVEASGAGLPSSGGRGGIAAESWTERGGCSEHCLVRERERARRPTTG